MYWYPRTRIGKASFWTAVGAFVLIYVQYWLQLIIQSEGGRPVRIVSGFLAMTAILVAGVFSVLALTKYRDRAYLLLISALLGVLGLLFLLGELLFPH